MSEATSPGEKPAEDKGTGPQELFSHCQRCGRGLTNPISMARGYGPVCITKIMRQLRLEEQIERNQEGA